MSDTRAVNFEFPLRQLPAALTYIAKHGLGYVKTAEWAKNEPTGFHLWATAQGASDDEVQCCATTWTSASDAQWFEFCEEFGQDCVAVVSQKWIDAYSPDAPTPDNFPGLSDALCVGPKPWPFDPIHFRLPPNARPLEA